MAYAEGIVIIERRWNPYIHTYIPFWIFQTFKQVDDSPSEIFCP